MFVELEVVSVLSKASDVRANILMLKERGGERRIIIAVGPVEAEIINRLLLNPDHNRILPHDLFADLAYEYKIEPKSVFIYNEASSGIFKGNVTVGQGDDEKVINARASDAVIVALRLEIPLFIMESQLERLCIHEEADGAVSVPLDAFDTKSIARAMEQAVKNENYEIANELKKILEYRRSRKKGETGDFRYF